MEASNIEKALKANIAYHTKELHKNSAMLALYNGGAKSNGSTPAKKAVKALKPAKKNGKIGVIHWEKPIKKLFFSNGNEALACAQIVNELFNGKHTSTKRVLKTRLSAMLSLYEKQNWIKAHRPADNKGFVTYNLNK